MKVGDYVRTENGIDKIIGYRYEPEYENGHVLWFKKSDSGCRCTDKDLPKSSPNIIDLIEVEDYINGLKVEKKYEDRVVINTRDEIIVWFEYQIKSIVTKEQFEKMKYIVCGDKNDNQTNN